MGEDHPGFPFAKDQMELPLRHLGGRAVFRAEGILVKLIDQGGSLGDILTVFGIQERLISGQLPQFQSRQSAGQQVHGFHSSSQPNEGRGGAVHKAHRLRSHGSIGRKWELYLAPIGGLRQNGVCGQFRCERQGFVNLPQFVVPLHIAEAGEGATFRLPVRLSNLRIVQQLERFIREVFHFRDESVFHEKPAQLLISHGLLYHMAALPAVGVVDQAADGNRRFSFLEVHRNQPLEGGHAAPVQFRQPRGKSVEREEMRLLYPLI